MTIQTALLPVDLAAAPADGDTGHMCAMVTGPVAIGGTVAIGGGAAGGGGGQPRFGSWAQPAYNDRASPEENDHDHARTSRPYS